MTPEQYKATREALGTQHEVAEALGVSRPTIARREAKSGRVTREAALAIRALSIPSLKVKRPFQSTD